MHVSYLVIKESNANYEEGDKSDTIILRPRIDVMEFSELSSPDNRQQDIKTKMKRLDSKKKLEKKSSTMIIKAKELDELSSISPIETKTEEPRETAASVTSNSPESKQWKPKLTLRK
jgi:hypothetical protein